MFSSQNSQVSSAVNYIEDMFSTYLYTGNGGSQTITNGIDLAGKGGLVWIKSRGLSGNNTLIDSVRGISKFLYTNDTSAQVNDPGTITSFNSNGFTQNNSYGDLNSSGRTYASWTFREQPKFFDVVTYTGNGGTQIINHSLASTPGCVIIKQLNATSLVGWVTYHRSVTNPNDNYLLLNTTGTPASAPAWISPTSTSFTLGNYDDINKNANTYVAYLFAHNADGFGLTGTDNVISCGTFTTDASQNATVNLGYEPQWLLCKSTSYADNWFIVDTMRGWTNNGGFKYLIPNSSSAELTYTGGKYPTATGFEINTGNPNSTYIYIAIRRPMKPPTLGTSVFAPYNTTSIAASSSGSTSASALYNNGFVSDMLIQRNKSGTDGWYIGPRLTGQNYMRTETSAAEVASGAAYWDSNIGAWNYNASYGVYAFRRAPGFFDVVCYTGDGTLSRNINHNLGVTPEFVIVKPRSGIGDWKVYGVAAGGFIVLLNSADPYSVASLSGGYVSSTSSTLISVNAWSSSVSAVNASSTTYVSYLFATCPNVSKVGSYIGTGSLQTINCGFTSGARFVLIKQLYSTGGNWYVWDSARGITSGNDPYLLLNTTAAEVTTTNYLDTDTTGFKVTAAAPAELNASGGTYIFLAIA